MNCFLRRVLPGLLASAAFVALASTAAAQTGTAPTPVPKVAPIAISADSVPFLAASQSLEPVDLKKFGSVSYTHLTLPTNREV